MIINGVGICYMLNVCVWPVIINGVGICYMLNVCVWPVIINGVGICYMLNVCVWPVIINGVDIKNHYGCLTPPAPTELKIHKNTYLWFLGFF